MIIVTWWPGQVTTFAYVSDLSLILFSDGAAEEWEQQLVDTRLGTKRLWHVMKIADDDTTVFMTNNWYY